MRRPTLLRRLAVLGGVLLAAALAVGTSVPASASGGKGHRDEAFLRIVSITDRSTGLGWPVEDRPFDVRVEVVDEDGDPVRVSRAIRIVLDEVSGPGKLRGTTRAVIPAGGSTATISGATYSQYANGVVLEVRTKDSRLKLAPDTITVEVALTAVSAYATPGERLVLKDPNCAAPTAKVPTCGVFVLENGARGRVIMSVGSCDGLVELSENYRGRQDCRSAGDAEALVVTAIANLKDNQGQPLYSKKSPAALVLICDKVLCGKSGYSRHDSKVKVAYTLRNTGPLTKIAPPCPDKGVLGKRQEACVDYERGRRSSSGDLYLPLLYTVDARASFP